MYDYKIDHQPLAQGGLIPGTLKKNLVLKHGVRHGHSMSRPKVQQTTKKDTWVQIREAILPDHNPPGSVRPLPTWALKSPGASPNLQMAPYQETTRRLGNLNRGSVHKQRQQSDPSLFQPDVGNGQIPCFLAKQREQQ
ncbi:hypothetical protein AMECASPLE_023189 [Ameca splendens]|uniref:Uncharacterized protein n=1 Tax=Ameca splendens TaxID=208324 RepID=A0ABV0YG77_9TELE